MDAVDISQFGIVGALFVYLVYWITNKLSNELSCLKESIDKLRNKIDELIKMLDNYGKI